jgi:hypothetical protein
VTIIQPFRQEIKATSLLSTRLSKKLKVFQVSQQYYNYENKHPFVGAILM